MRKSAADARATRETVKVVFDPEELSLPFLLEQYYSIIDPVSVNKQGNDRGVQYRHGHLLYG